MAAHTRLGVNEVPSKDHSGVHSVLAIGRGHSVVDPSGLVGDQREVPLEDPLKP